MFLPGSDGMLDSDKTKEQLMQLMAEAFQIVLLVLPQKPSDPVQYKNFLNRTQTYATKPPLDLDEPIFPIKVSCWIVASF